MFPLGSVLVPGAVLPLHVFEPRYRALVRECLERDEPEFGVALIERGSEVGGGDHRRDIAVVARMLQVAEMEDGRYAVVSVGTRRVRVVAWLPDDPFPLADVDDWPEADDDPDATLALATRLWPSVRRLAATAVELGDRIGGQGDVTMDELADDPVVASYQLCLAAPVSAADLYDLLCEPGPLARLTRLETLLPDLAALQSFRLSDDD
jgi:Lon protease-like protein